MIRSKNLLFSVGGFRIEEVSLDVADGEYFVLLGPPGSGKTVLLECFCGLNRPESGCVLINNRDVTHLEPRLRRIGYVPQDYALFPHLSVESNIASGLHARRKPPGQRRKRTDEVADMLDIRHLLKRRIGGLSGGEKQRVALARALAIEPHVLLLDEPVSALDEVTRERVCADLRQLQHSLRISTIHVSHSLEEAFSLADRGAVMRHGRFQQVGSLQDLFRRPVNEFVAGFMRCENILSGRSAGRSPDDHTRVATGRAEFVVPGRHEGTIRFVIRPEHIGLMRRTRVPKDRPQTVLPVTITHVEDRAAYVRLKLRGPIDLVAHLAPSSYAELAPFGQTNLAAVIRSESIHVLPS
jgi:ABC-type sugar transport system ATPase subunit